MKSIRNGLFFLLFVVIEGVGYSSNTKQFIDTNPLVSKSKYLIKSIGKIKRINKNYHCVAFAISKIFLMTSSDCIAVNYDGEPIRESLLLSIDRVTTKVYVEAVYPHKRFAFLSVRNHILQKPISRSFGAPHSIAYEQSNSKWFREEIDFFIKNTMIYYHRNFPDIKAGSPIFDKEGGYVGIHLGSAWYQGKTYSIGNHKGLDFNIFETVSFQPDNTVSKDSFN